MYSHLNKNTNLYVFATYSSGAVAVADSFFGPGTGPIIFDAVECEGDESSLLLCPHNGLGSHDCTHEEDASVICQREFVTINCLSICENCPHCSMTMHYIIPANAS